MTTRTRTARAIRAAGIHAAAAIAGLLIGYFGYLALYALITALAN